MITHDVEQTAHKMMKAINKFELKYLHFIFVHQLR